MIALLSLVAVLAQDAPTDATDAKAFRAFAASIETTINGGDPEVFKAAMDADLLAERIRLGIDPPFKGLEAYLNGFKKGFRSSNSLAADIVESNEANDGSYVFLRMMPKDPSHALFRWAGDDGLEYHQLALHRDEDGSVKIADFLPMSMGEWTSESSRQFIVDAAAQRDRSLWQRLTGDETDFGAAMLQFTAMLESANEDPQAVLEIYGEMPASMQRRIQVQRLRINAASFIDDATYLAALKDFERLHPKSPALALISIDAHILMEEFAAAHKAVDQLDGLVHGDPYLDILRAQLHLHTETYDKARGFLRTAVKRDDRLEEAAVWEHLNISLALDNHEQTFRRLRWLYFNSDWYIGDVSDLEAYAEFHKSDYGQRWALIAESMDEDDR